MLLSATQVARLTLLLTKRPLPSHIVTLTPPGCRLRAAMYVENAFADDNPWLVGSQGYFGLPETGSQNPKSPFGEFGGMRVEN